MNLNLKMAVERSKRRSYFLSLVFITKCLNLSKAQRKKEKVRNIVMFFSENKKNFICIFTNKFLSIINVNLFMYIINYFNETKKKIKLLSS